MSKHFSTKKKILDLLKEKPRTRTQLAKELGLAPSTVSQHIGELETEGAIAQDNRSSSRKWKYYRARNGFKNEELGRPSGHNQSLTIGIAIALVLAAALVLFYTHSPMNYIPTNSIPMNHSAVNSTITPSVSTAACPIILSNQTFISSIESYSNMTFYNDSGMPEYIVAPGSTGTMTLELNKPLTSSNISISNFAAIYYNESGKMVYAANSTDMFSVGFNRSSEYLTAALPNATLLVRISVLHSAAPGTYRVIIPEGPCRPQAQAFYLTVGNKPYTGSEGTLIMG